MKDGYIQRIVSQNNTIEPALALHWCIHITLSLGYTCILLDQSNSFSPSKFLNISSRNCGLSQYVVVKLYGLKHLPTPTTLSKIKLFKGALAPDNTHYFKQCFFPIDKFLSLFSYGLPSFFQYMPVIPLIYLVSRLELPECVED